MAITPMNRSQKRCLRFKVSVVWALVSAMVVFIGGYALVTLVKVKRIGDLATHSVRLANQIENLPAFRSYLLEENGAPSKEEAESMLGILLEGDPFIEETILTDQFGKVFFRILKAENKIREGLETSSIPFPLQDILTHQQPSFVEKDWEYRVPISLDSNIPWGILQVRWRPDATWKYFWLLKVSIAYITGGAFCVSFLAGFFLLRRTYDREQNRLTESLSLICGSDYTQRIDTQSFSRGFAEIGVHMNRILHEIEEEKKKSEILDQSLRQIERGCSDYRRALNERLAELDLIRREMRESLIHLFDLLWCGVVVIDDQYRIQYINELAERLLRFARMEDSVLSDERLKTCLSPLIRHGSVDAVDDLCVWPQPALGQSVSCHVRAARIPTGGGDRLYYLLLREEGGYPKKHNSAYYSERLVLDYLVHDPRLEDAEEQGQGISFGASLIQEDRFRACLRRLETFHVLEKGDVGPVSSIRLTSWLRNHFSEEDVFARYLHLDANVPDLDISLRIPERILREFMDTIVVLISGMIESKKLRASQYMVIRASVDSRGKPMITLSLPGLKKKEAAHIHEVLNERVVANHNEDGETGNLEDLEIDICYSLFRCVKQLLRAHIVCVYSEIKKLAMVRLTIENQSFTPNYGPSDPVEIPPEPSPNKDLIHQFLSRM